MNIFSLLKRIPEFTYRLTISKKLRKEYLVNTQKPLMLIGEDRIQVGSGFSTASFVRIEAWSAYAGQAYSPQIEIGNNCFFNFGSHIGSIEKVRIGNNVLLGSYVTILDHNHGDSSGVRMLQIPPMNRPLVSKGPIIIGDNVWICDKATILGGVTIGEGAIIAANAVVVSDIPAYSVAAGSPAKIVKKLRIERDC